MSVPTTSCPTHHQSQPELLPWFRIPPRHSPKNRRGSGIIHQERTCLKTHFHVACPPIEIEMQILNLSIIGELFGNILLCCLLVDIGYENDPSFYRCVEDKHHNETRKPMKYNSTHIVPLGYPSLALVSIQRGRKSALTLPHFRSQLRGICRHQSLKHCTGQGYKPAELWKPRPLFRIVPPPLATWGENKLIIMKKKISVDTYPHQCSFHHQTWWFAKPGVVMDDKSMSVVGSVMRCEKPPQRISQQLFGGVGTVGLTDVPFWGRVRRGQPYQLRFSYSTLTSLSIVCYLYALSKSP